MSGAREHAMVLPVFAAPDFSTRPAIAFDATSARAQTDDAPAGAEIAKTPAIGPRVVLSGRGSAGPGWGTLGVGARLGAGGEYWLARAFGVGLEGAVSAQTTLTAFGPSTSGTVFLLVPKLALRSASEGNYLFADFGAGYADVERTHDPGCLDLFGRGACASTSAGHRPGFAATGSIGWMVHTRTSALEAGPLLRADLVGPADSSQPVDALVTLNLALGFAAHP